MGGLMLLVADRLELEGAMGHIEMSAQALAEPVQHLARATLADARVVHDDMRGQHRYATGDRPGMQVMHVDHTAYPLDVISHLSKIDPPRSRLQEHIDDLAEQ